jgi:hypothetical protein
LTPGEYVRLAPSKSHALERIRMNEIERAIELVTASITFSYIDKNEVQSKAVPLDSGIAVILDNRAAYWVKDNVVYAANGAAKMYSRGTKYSPMDISYQEIKNAMDDSVHPY